MSEKLSVIKIPKENNVSSTDVTKEHPRVPYMYLELLENKNKIKPEVVNKDYDPSDAISVKSFSNGTNDINKNKQTNNNTIEKIDEESEISVSEEENSIEESIQSVSSVEEDNDDDMSIEDDNSSSVTVNSTKNKLKEMLDDEYSSTQLPPKLSDLQRSGVIKTDRAIPNIDMMDEEEDDEDKKRELLFRFSLLRKSYNSQIEIPEFTIHSNYKTMVSSYENCLRHLSLESSVEQYKNLLIAGFMGCEFVFGNWFNLDMSGYTQSQVLNLAQYERLLIELGSKNYSPESANYPVEFRLIGMIVLNAVIFLVGKLILKKTGNNIMNMMNQNVRNKYTESFESTTNNFFQSQNGPMQEEKKKMKKPTFDFSSL